MGLEGMGDFLQNFSLIRLGKISIKHAKNLPDQRVLNCLQNTGYPCLVDDDLSVHPTHGNYQQFKNGQPPLNLLPVRTVPITLDEILGDEIYVEREQETPKQSPATATTSPSFDIKKLVKKPENNSNPNDINRRKFEAITSYCQRKGETTVRKIQQGKLLSDEYKLDSNFIKYALDMLSDQGLITLDKSSEDWIVCWVVG
jgi:hypothetical protein